MRIIIIYLLLFILYIASGYAQTVILPASTSVYDFAKMPAGLYKINQPGDTVLLSKDSLICQVCQKFYSIFTTQTPSTITQTDGRDITLGVKFRTSQAGKILGIKFYKNTKNTGTHIGQLYTITGVLLWSQAFTNESASGWQTILFSTPIVITPNITYVAAYYSQNGGYTSQSGGFTNAVTNGPLTGLKSGTDGVNGVYSYGQKFPTLTYQNSNYWVDLLFLPD